MIHYQKNHMYYIFFIPQSLNKLNINKNIKFFKVISLLFHKFELFNYTILFYLIYILYNNFYFIWLTFLLNFW